MRAATRTREALTPEQAQADLEAARAASAAVLERISAGEDVQPGELLDAEATVRMCEVRVQLGERNAAAAAERARLGRLRELADSLTDAGHRQRLEVLVAAYRKALVAVQELHQAAHARQEGVKADLLEVGRLARAGAGTLPDGVEVELDAWGCQALTANGVRAQLSYYQDEPVALLADLAATVVAGDTNIPPIGQDLLSAAGSQPGSQIARLERLLDESA